MSPIIRDLDPQTVKLEGVSPIVAGFLLWIPALVLGTSAFIFGRYNHYVIGVMFSLGALGFCYASASCFFKKEKEGDGREELRKEDY